MTQAPTPGPLSGDGVNRECKACGAFKAERDAACMFCGLAPTAPVEASGSELHPATADLVDRFAAELKSKLARAEAKYGYRDNWSRPDWEDELTESLAEHIQKGDPRDVAAYCAFAWHHGWSTSDAAGYFAPALRPQPSGETREAEAGREAIWKVVHALWQLLDDGETGADGAVTIDQARYQEVSAAMDELEALVPDSEGPTWGGFPVNYFWGLK